MFDFKLNNKKIAVIGDVMLDHYLYGICDRISPEAPVQVIDISSESYTLGGAGNVLKNLISLGCPSGLITVCGNDFGAGILKSEVERISTFYYKLICNNTRKTTIKTRVIASKHQLIRLDRENKNDIDFEAADEVIIALNSIINEIDVLIMSDYCKGVLNEVLVKKITEICKAHKVTTMVDSKDRNLSKYLNVDIVKPNKKEASIASGINIIDDKTLEEACMIIAETTKCKTVIVTLSEEGMAIYHQGRLDKIPTRAIEVFDVTGAGDTVIASLAVAISNGMTIHEACDFANHAAAVVVAKIGSATASIKEINELKTN